MSFKDRARRVKELAAQVASNEAQLAALRDLNKANSHRLSQLNRELNSQNYKREVQSVLEQRLDQTFDEVSDLTEQLLDRSNRLLEVEAELKSARRRVTSLESQLRHQVQLRQRLEIEISEQGAEFANALKRERRISESVSAVLDLLASGAGEPDAGTGQAIAGREEEVIEMLVAALGENPPD